MSGFAKIRNGIKRHIEGKDGVKKFMPPAELGVYVFLHLYCDYDTGIYRGSAGSIAGTMGCPRSTVRDALHRLRDRQFINFKSEQGVGAAYDIFIDKFEPTFGRHFGYRLSAWTNKDLPVAAYEKIEDDRQLDDGSPTVPRALDNGSPPVSQTPRPPGSQTEQTPSVGEGVRATAPSAQAPGVSASDQDPAVGLMRHFYTLIGRLEKYKGKGKAWTALVRKLGTDTEHIRAVMDWTFESDVWARAITSVQRVDPMEYFCEKYQSIEAGMQGDKVFAEKREKRLRELAAQTKKAMQAGTANADKPAYRQKPGGEIVKEGDVIKL